METKTKILFSELAVVSLLFLNMGLAPVKLQNDTFYSIKTGEFIFENGVTKMDPFSIHDIPYTFPHWLYDCMTYLVFDTFGYAGIYVSTILLAWILGIVLYGTCSRTANNNLISFILAIAGLYLLRVFIAARAQLVTFILFALAVYFIEMFLEKKQKRYGAGLAVISVLIANLHSAAWPFLFVLFLPYIAEYLLCVLLDSRLLHKIINPYKVKTERNDFTRQLAVVLLICILAGVLTPLGSTPYTYLYNTMKGSSMQSIAEHVPLVLYNSREFLCLITVFLLFLIFTDFKIKLSDLFMLAGLLLLALMSRRQMSMFIIISLPILAKFLSDFFNRYVPGATEKFIKMMITPIGKSATIFIILAAAVLLFKAKWNDSFVDEHTYPIQAVKYIRENLDTGKIRLFNEYVYGSYLLMNDIKVFIDSRADLYTKEFNGTDDIFGAYFSTIDIGRYYEDTFDEYNISHVIVSVNTKLNMLLSRDHNYTVLHKDGRFIVYERTLYGTDRTDIKNDLRFPHPT